MSSDYTEPPKVPALEVTGYVFYSGGASKSRTTTAPSIEGARNNILYRWARQEMGRKSIPIGAEVVVTSTKRVFVPQKTRAGARTQARALAAK